MAKRIVIAVGSALTIMLLIYSFWGIKLYATIQGFKNQVQHTYVSDEAARLETWPPFFMAVGNLTPVQGVEVTNELAGIVTGIHFESGQEVKKGELLLQLDDSAERAQLLGFQAQIQLTKINYQRAQELFKRNLNAQSDVDTAESNFKQAQSNLDNDQAAISKKAIRAPFSGRIGIRNVNLGQYLAAGSDIASLQSLDTLYAQFTLPEQDLAQLAPRQRVEVTTDTYPDKVFSGEVTAIDSRVDPATHNVSVQAIIRNPQHLLRAGMFASAHVYAGKPVQVVSIPKTAISYSLYGDSVFVVQQDGKDKGGKPVLKVTEVFVKLGSERGNRVAVTEGLKAGDVVVTSGQQKLHTGTQVDINNSVSVD